MSAVVRGCRATLASFIEAPERLDYFLGLVPGLREKQSHDCLHVGALADLYASLDRRDPPSPDLIQGLHSGLERGGFFSGEITRSLEFEAAIIQGPMLLHRSGVSTDRVPATSRIPLDKLRLTKIELAHDCPAWLACGARPSCRQPAPGAGVRCARSMPTMLQTRSSSHREIYVGRRFAG